MKHWIQAKLDKAGADRSTTRGIIARIFADNFLEFAPKYAIAFAFMAAVAATTSLSAWIMRDVVNEIFVAKDFSRLLQVTLAIITIFAVKGVASYGQMVTLSRVGNAIVAKNQKRLYAHLLICDAAFFQQHGASDLITRISHSANAVREVINLLVTSIGRDLLSLIGLVTVMVLQDPLLSLISMVIAPPAILGIAYLVRRVRALARAEVLSLARIVQVMQETAIGIRIIQSFGIQPHMKREMNKAIGDVEARANKISELGARSSPLMETLGGCAFATVILYSGWQSILLGKSPGEFISFLTALLLAYEPAKRISRLQVHLETGLIGGRMIYEILEKKPNVVDQEKAPQLKVGRGEIVLHNTGFCYISGYPVLHELDLHVKAGEVTALVGPSGGGKSTILALVQRLYDVNSGSVSIDGQNVKDVQLSSLHEAISLVTQDTVLFTGTIKDNIAFGRPDASFEQIKQAAKSALADEFIESFANGYETRIGEAGISLSGGQRQRLAIARAILKNAPILLLDEATSALDNETEAKLQKALEHLMRGRTTLVIAHRLSTIRHADTICLIKNGSLVEAGNHSTLMANNGPYAALYGMQFSREEAAVLQRKLS
ncbi:ABC transporter ATP-binding protein [Polycladidibacter stylochi]|uniref:ABC transporter ATP-binding protein n=1 Tax=Polycladidibacter stylochi TaxID=1807766 RepID=UPI000A8DEE65|nr:ABC transporter ATP-binding protein [Pseudovibrio stylochi]